MQSKRRSRTRIATDAAAVGAVVLLVAYMLVLAFPSPAFPYQFEGEVITIHSAAPVDSGVVAALVEDVQTRFDAAGLDMPVWPIGVYLTGTRRQFSFFANRSHRSFAVSYVAFGTSFVAPSDPRSNLVRSSRQDQGNRTLGGVVAHEATHHFLRERLGFVRAYLLPEWKKEGICEYVAGESTFDEGMGLRLLKEGRSEPSRAFAYLRARMLVTHLIEDRGMTIEEVLDGDIDPEAVEASLRRHLQR